MKEASYVLCVTLNPVLDTAYFVDQMRPVYRTEAHRVTHIAGGKGNNVARALGLLGVKAHSLAALAGMIGRNVAEVWKDDPFEATPVWASGETRLQITVIDTHRTQRSFYAPTAEFSADDAERMEAAFDRLVSAASTVCVCGSSPGRAADSLYRRFLESSAGYRALTVLDTYGDALRQGLAARPHVVKVNRAEAEGFFGRAIRNTAAEHEAVRGLRQAGADIAVLTLGERGALMAAGDDVWHAEPPRVEALNPIGSGDAMTAGIVAALLRGASQVDAFRFGMAVAAANTLSWDACRFDGQDVERLEPMVEIERAAIAG